MRVLVPPIKCQGIKTKLVPSIRSVIEWNADGTWIEPFLGSGVVALNVAPARAFLADANPHVVRFYKAIQDGDIDGHITRAFLEVEGDFLYRRGKEYYYEVRERFNDTHEPLDFLFLNRSCFNGMIRFNKSGRFNVPFGHKPKRFAPAYVTKIVNQVERFREVVRDSDWRFECRNFESAIVQANRRDFIYCDPPYAGRHVDYYDSWDEKHERLLRDSLASTGARFLLSTWHSNQHRRNELVDTLWGEHHLTLQQHFYHVGAKESNRKPILEALVTNYAPAEVAAEEVMASRTRQEDMFEVPLENVNERDLAPTVSKY